MSFDTRNRDTSLIRILLTGLFLEFFRVRIIFNSLATVRAEPTLLKKYVSKNEPTCKIIISLSIQGVPDTDQNIVHGLLLVLVVAYKTRFLFMC